MKKRYPTDLTDAEWKHIEPFVPAPKCRGRQRIHTPREILDAAFYVLRSGCAWRLLPKTQRGAARALADLLRQGSAAQRGHRRLTVGQDHWCGRRSARI